MATCDRDLAAYAAAVATALEKVPLITGVEYYVDHVRIYCEGEETNVSVLANAADYTYHVEVL